MEGARNISSQASRYGIDAEIICLDEPGSPWLADWTVSVNAIGNVASRFGYTSKLEHWFRDNVHRFDALVVHGIWMYFSLAAWKAATAHKIPYYLFIHGALDPWFKRRYPHKHVKKAIYWRLFEHNVLRDARAVLFTTEEEKTLAHNSFRPYECSPVVVGYGIKPPFTALDDLTQTEKVRSLTADFPDLRSRQFLLYLGRIHEKKGIDLLLRAFAQLRGRYSDCALVLAGPGDQKILDNLQALVARLGMRNQVVWTGPVYGRSKWLAISAASAFVLPSHQENFGISVAEALACGTPVLISNKVNIWREVDRDEAGLIESDDLAGTTRMLSRWADLNAVARERMSSNAKRCFYSHFDITGNCNRFFELLHTSAGKAIAARVA